MAEAGSLVIESAEGCWLTTTDGQKLFDGVSSMWCNIHGHRNPRLDSAIREQLDRVAHVTSLGMSCDTTDRFAQALVAICPGELNHVFLSSDGASAVEAAIKMALQYWRQCDHPHPEKTNYLALGRSYHGDTTGCVSLGGIDLFHKIFSPLLFQPLRGPLPCSYRLPTGVEPADAADHYAGEIESILRDHHRSLAAVVIEPLIQGAAGMITHPVGFLARVSELCKTYNVLLICDEVATGFGRTGKMFACEHEAVTPDILCLGKGITGGYLPMAATVATSQIFDAFLGRSEQGRQFFHGHTYSGNPLAAAVALASLELFDEQQLVDKAREHGKRMRDRLARLTSHPNVGDIRGRGMMIGIDLVEDRETRQPLAPHSELVEDVCQRSLQRGLWIRPLGDVLVLMPPIAATSEDLDWMVDVVVESIQESAPKST